MRLGRCFIVFYWIFFVCTRRERASRSGKKQRNEQTKKTKQSACRKYRIKFLRKVAVMANKAEHWNAAIDNSTCNTYIGVCTPSHHNAPKIARQRYNCVFASALRYFFFFPFFHFISWAAPTRDPISVLEFINGHLRSNYTDWRPTTRINLCVRLMCAQHKQSNDVSNARDRSLLDIYTIYEYYSQNNSQSPIRMHMEWRRTAAFFICETVRRPQRTTTYIGQCRSTYCCQLNISQF